MGYIQMPRLIKHSKIAPEPSEDSGHSLTTPSASHVHESAAKELLEPRKMKMEQRWSLFKQAEGKIADRLSAQNGEESQTDAQEDSKEGSTGGMGMFLSRFAEEDESLVQPDQPKRRKSKGHNEIKIKNRMFSGAAIELDGTVEEVQVENLPLEVKPKSKRPDPTHLMEQMQKRASMFRNRLEFKEGQSQKQMTEDMRDKLKEIESGQEIVLEVERPKAVNKESIDAALLIKQQQTQSQEEPEKVVIEEKKKPTQHQNAKKEEQPKNRRQFYQELGRKLKVKRAESFTENALKEAFKKSKLDDSDFIEELINREGEQSLSRMNSISQSQMTQRNMFKQSGQVTARQSLIEEKEGLQQSNAQIEIGTTQEEQLQRQRQISIQSLKPPPQVTQKTEKKESFLQQNGEQSISFLQDKKTRKIKDAKRIKKQRKAFLSEYLEEEAENSGEEDGAGQGEESEEDEDGYITDMIDDDFALDSVAERQAHRLFVEKVREMEDKKYEEEHRKAKIKYQEDQKIKERMREAARKNKKQDDQQFDKTTSEKVQVEGEDSKSSTAKYQDNLKKISELEQNLGIRTREGETSLEEQSREKELFAPDILDKIKVAKAHRRPVSKGLKGREVVPRRLSKGKK